MQVFMKQECFIVHYWKYKRLDICQAIRLKREKISNPLDFSKIMVYNNIKSRFSKSRLDI